MWSVVSGGGGVDTKKNSGGQAPFIFWGKDCLSKLNGMFSFAIYDTHEKTLFAAPVIASLSLLLLYDEKIPKFDAKLLKIFSLSSRALFHRILKKFSEELKLLVCLCQVMSDLIKYSIS